MKASSGRLSKKLSIFFREIKRRKVLQTSTLYILILWGALQVGDVIFPALGIDSEKANFILLIVGMAGLFLTISFSWFYQISSKSIVRTESFVERRVLENPSPFNIRRRTGEKRLLNADDENVYHWIITSETGPLAGFSYLIDQQFVLGRSLDCDLSVVNPQISRQHLRIDINSDGELFVEDLDSANGTCINGVKISSRQAISDQDELSILDVVFRFTAPSSNLPLADSALSKTMVADTFQKN